MEMALQPRADAHAEQAGYPLWRAEMGRLVLLTPKHRPSRVGHQAETVLRNVQSFGKNSRPRVIRSPRVRRLQTRSGQTSTWTTSSTTRVGIVNRWPVKPSSEGTTHCPLRTS